MGFFGCSTAKLSLAVAYDTDKGVLKSGRKLFYLLLKLVEKLNALS